MGFVFLGLFSLSFTPFVMFLLLFFNLKIEEGETEEEVQAIVLRRLWKSGWFYLWLIYTILGVAFVIAANNQ